MITRHNHSVAWIRGAWQVSRTAGREITCTC